MAVDVPDVEEFDRPELRLSPEMHQVQAEMAAKRGEEYDPVEFELEIAARRKEMPDLDEAAEPVEGNEDLFQEWLEAGE